MSIARPSRTSRRSSIITTRMGTSADRARGVSAFVFIELSGSDGPSMSIIAAAPTVEQAGKTACPPTLHVGPSASHARTPTNRRHVEESEAKPLDRRADRERHNRPQPGAGRDIQRPTEPLGRRRMLLSPWPSLSSEAFKPGAVVGDGQDEPGSFNPATNLHAT